MNTFEQGLDFHERGRYKESLQRLEEAAQQPEHSENPLLFYILGICLREDWANEDDESKGKSGSEGRTFLSNLLSGSRGKGRAEGETPLKVDPPSSKTSKASGQRKVHQHQKKLNMNRAVACFQKSLDLTMDILVKFEEENGTDTLSRLRASISSFRKSQLAKDGRWVSPGPSSGENYSKSPNSTHSLSKKDSVKVTPASEPSPSAIESSSNLKRLDENKGITLAAKEMLSMPLLELGYCNFFGWGIPKNRSRAIYYFNAAALLGSRDAQYQLGYMYEQALYVKRDFAKSSKYYRMYVGPGKKPKEYTMNWIYLPRFATLPIEPEDLAFNLVMEQLKKPPPDDLTDHSGCVSGWLPFRRKK